MSSAEHDELYSESLAYVEQLYERFLEDPHSVPESWQETFATMNESDQFDGRISFAPSFAPKSIFHSPNGHALTPGQVAALAYELLRDVRGAAPDTRGWLDPVS